jgi:S1-C subfamily serine protease
MNAKKSASIRCLCASLILFALAYAALGQAPPLPTELSSEEVIARVAPSVAVVLTGAGAGRLSGVGSAIIVRSDGILLTAYHVIKDAREVQVRLKTGEIYDRVELIAVDERRDVAPFVFQRQTCLPCQSHRSKSRGLASQSLSYPIPLG